MNCAVNCAKATITTGGDGEFVSDETISCDPAGTIFDETLEDLNDMDRELLLFSAGTNLAAVRWLFVLGADKFSQDSNGTTALHTACRTGSLPIIRELLRQGIPLDISDNSGWSPLHIAIFMCRRDAVLCLLQVSAPLSVRNEKGQTPLDLCNDAWTREAIRSYTTHMQRHPDQPWHFEKEQEAEQGISLPNRLQYEPFFVPRSPVIPDDGHKQDFFTLGQLIFNKKPGQGLAFLVASGCTRDYPVDLSFFLRRGKLDMGQIGQFLGESFSLSQTLRLEFINSVKFHGTSIVSGLAKVFTLLQIPPDLQKIDRLIFGVARIWWRQHDKISEDEEERGNEDEELSREMKKFREAVASERKPTGEAELESFELKQYLVSPETLYQLMFSVVMLHWNLYAPSSGGQSGEESRISLESWLEINRGLEADGSDVPLHILQRTYHTVRRGFVPQLTIRVSSSNADGKSNKGSLMKDAAVVESWGWIKGGPRHFSKLSSSGASKSTHIPNIFSESLSKQHPVARSNSLGSNFGIGRPVLPGAFDANGGKDRVWMSLCHTLLFLSSSPHSDEAPYAFVHLKQVLVDRSAPHDVSTLAFVGNPDIAAMKEGHNGETGNDNSSKTNKRPPVAVVFLLPDGRWQVFELPRLELQVADAQQREKWIVQLRSVCGEAFVPSTPAPHEERGAFSPVPTTPHPPAAD